MKKIQKIGIIIGVVSILVLILLSIWIIQWISPIITPDKYERLESDELLLTKVDLPDQNEFVTYYELNNDRNRILFITCPQDFRACVPKFYFADTNGTILDSFSATDHPQYVLGTTLYVDDANNFYFIQSDKITKITPDFSMIDIPIFVLDEARAKIPEVLSQTKKALHINQYLIFEFDGMLLAFTEYYIDDWQSLDLTEVIKGDDVGSRDLKTGEILVEYSTRCIFAGLGDGCMVPEDTLTFHGHSIIRRNVPIRLTLSKRVVTSDDRIIFLMGSETHGKQQIYIGQVTENLNGTPGN